MADESTTPLYITTAISVALVLLEQYLAHSSCASNSTTQLLLAQIRGCRKATDGKGQDTLPYPLPPASAPPLDGVQV